MLTKINYTFPPKYYLLYHRCNNVSRRVVGYLCFITLTTKSLKVI